MTEGLAEALVRHTLGRPCLVPSSLLARPRHANLEVFLAIQAVSNRHNKASRFAH